MRVFAIVIFSFFSVLSVLIYLTKNYQYERYIFKEKKLEKQAYLININLATWHDFASLPGISDSLAKTIIEDRDKKGRFETIKDIKRVKGIGRKKLEQIKEYLTLDV